MAHALPFCPMNAPLVYVTTPPKPSYNSLDILTNTKRKLKYTHSIGWNSLRYCLNYHLLSPTGEEFLLPTQEFAHYPQLYIIKESYIFLPIIDARFKYFLCLETTFKWKMFYSVTILHLPVLLLKNIENLL